jgi:hypothetical protein
MTAIEVIIYLLSVCRSMLLLALFFFSWRFILYWKVLKLLPTLLPGVVMRGDILKTEMSDFEKCADGLFVTQGLGLMWGALVNRSHPLASDMPRLMAALRKGCAEHLILPYFVPAGGFMITPLFDVEPGVLREVGVRLKLALKCTIAILVSEAS